MKNKDSVFGLCNVIRNYGWKNYIIDSIIPTIISLVLCIIIYLSDNDVSEQIKYVSNLGLTIVPSMTAFILAAYAIMLTFVFEKAKDKLKQTKEGCSLIQSINGGFAACLLISILTIIFLVFVSLITNIHLELNIPHIVYYLILFLICYLLVYSISILFGVIIDVFNSGQTILVE